MERATMILHLVDANKAEEMAAEVSPAIVVDVDQDTGYVTVEAENEESFSIANMAARAVCSDLVARGAASYMGEPEEIEL